MGRVSRTFSVPVNLCIPSGDLSNVNVFSAIKDKCPARLTIGPHKVYIGTHSFWLMIWSSHGKTRYLEQDCTFTSLQLPRGAFRYSFHNFVHPLESGALPVDGFWECGNHGITPKRVGYDRLVAFRDLSIRDYTVTFRITIHAFAVDATGDPESMGPGVGILVRWRGHDPYGNSLFQEWRPIVALAWYRYGRDITDRTRDYRLQLIGERLKAENQNEPITEDVSGKKTPLGIPLIFRVKVCSNQSWPSIYYFAVLLVLHYTDATIYEVNILRKEE